MAENTPIITGIAGAAQSALVDFNHDYGTAYTFGSNFSNVGTDFETYVNKYLFPKINETNIINIALGNRFDFLAKEVDFIGQYSEDYVIMDTVPINMNLSKNEELLLKRNYPRIASRLYGQGILKKTKFTLNDNDVRLNFNTFADAVSYALGVYKKALSDINVAEERELKAMLIDYSLNQCENKRTVVSNEDLAREIYVALLNMQNNSSKYNECSKASGGSIGRYTTQTPLKDVVILTNDELKAYILDSKIANTFQISGLDITNKIISFDDLGGAFKTNEEITITDPKTVEYFKTYGDYQIEVNDKIPEGTIFTIDVSTLTEFTDKVTEINPPKEKYAYIFDINKVRYKRYTKDMVKSFYNAEFNEINYWLHYYSFKAVSPFYNNVLITEA